MISWLVLIILIIRRASRKTLIYRILSLISNKGGVQIKRCQPVGERGLWSFSYWVPNFAAFYYIGFPKSQNMCYLNAMQIFLKNIPQMFKYSSKCYLTGLQIFLSLLPRNKTEQSPAQQSLLFLYLSMSKQIMSLVNLCMFVWRMHLSGELFYICLDNIFV